MIPQRTFSNEFPGSGVRDRVSACRKRLRESRSNATPARLEVERISESLQRTNWRTRFKGNAEEMLFEAEGQGVGIT